MTLFTYVLIALPFLCSCSIPDSTPPLALSITDTLPKDTLQWNSSLSIMPSMPYSPYGPDDTMSAASARKVAFTIRYTGSSLNALYFDSTGRLIARSNYAIRSSYYQGPLTIVEYPDSTPSPSFFFSKDYHEHYHYDASTLKLTKLPYEYLDNNSSGYVAVGKKNEFGEKYAFIDLKMRLICPFIYDKVGYFDYDKEIVAVQRNGKWGAINKKGKEIIPCEYGAARWEENKRGKEEIKFLKGTWQNSKWIFFNNKGRKLSKIEAL